MDAHRRELSRDSSVGRQCDHSHKHKAPSRPSDHGHRGAGNLDKSYPRKLCIALVQVVLQQLSQRGMILQASSLADISQHPLMAAQHSKILAGEQPRTQRVPHVVPDHASIAVFYTPSISTIPCSIMQKLATEITLHTLTGAECQVPAHSRFLRYKALSSPIQGGESGGQPGQGPGDDHAQPYKKSRAVLELRFEVVFGLPWSYKGFIERVATMGHPKGMAFRVPEELQLAIDKHLEWNDKQLAKFRYDRCKQWLELARTLEAAEREDRAKRPIHVQQATAEKRLLLTEAILREINYEDVGAVQVLREGATLAGAVADIPAFQKVFKPGLCTVKQLEGEAARRNATILNMTKSSGDPKLDEQLLKETREEVDKGWAQGPFELSALEEGATISRRFPLAQRDKIRLIDDYTVSGVNDSCSSAVKVELHLIDTFAAVLRSYFTRCVDCGADSTLVAKTFDLKSAYRQVPIAAGHLKYGYFSIFNCENGRAEIYRMLTLPFGASHSVYSFLRLARVLYAIAVKGLYLLSTNFYDDYILAAKPSMVVSSENAIQLVFLLTGWIFAKEGSKATVFSAVCKALGVEFNLSRSSEQLAFIANTSRRVEDLSALIDSSLAAGQLSKTEALSLRGKL